MMAGVTEKQMSLSETSFHSPWEWIQEMKANPRRKKRTIMIKLTLDLESASIVRPRRMRHTPTGTMDKFDEVRTISKDTNTSGQSRAFVSMTNSETRTGENRNIGLGNASADPEVDKEKTSRQRSKARISTSTKLPGIDRVTPPIVTPLVENGASLEEALNNDRCP